MDLDVVKTLVRSSRAAWGATVRAGREALDLSQAEFVALIDGVSVQTISKIELGQLDPRDYLKVAIAAALGAEAEAIFPLPRRADVLALTPLEGDE